jgi:hypothetical protein
MDDTDLAGPILFCLLFATFLLLVYIDTECANGRVGKVILDMYMGLSYWELFPFISY